MNTEKIEEKDKTKEEKEIKYINLKSDVMINNKSKIITKFFKAVFLFIIIVGLYNIFLVGYTKSREKEGRSFFGTSAYVITTNSMKPMLNVGDIVIAKDLKEGDKEKAELKIGDIIVYKNKDDRNVTHRIVDKKDNIFITKGDNNNVLDKENIKCEEIVGKAIFKIPYLGKVFLGHENIFYILVLVLIMGVIYLKLSRIEKQKNIKRQEIKEYLNTKSNIKKDNKD